MRDTKILLLRIEPVHAKTCDTLMRRVHNFDVDRIIKTEMLILKIVRVHCRFFWLLPHRCPTGDSRTNVRTTQCAYTVAKCWPSSCWGTATKELHRARSCTSSRKPRRASVTRASHRRRPARDTDTEIFNLCRTTI